MSSNAKEPIRNNLQNNPVFDITKETVALAKAKAAGVRPIILTDTERERMTVSLSPVCKKKKIKTNRLNLKEASCSLEYSHSYYTLHVDARFQIHDLSSLADLCY